MAGKVQPVTRWDRLPDLSEPPPVLKVSQRAWISQEEYKLYEATRKRAHDPKQERDKWESEQLHDYMLFAVDIGLRPDEPGALNSAMSRSWTILEIEVRGKRSVGYCKSMPGTARLFDRLPRRLRALQMAKSRSNQLSARFSCFPTDLSSLTDFTHQFPARYYVSERECPYAAVNSHWQARPVTSCEPGRTSKAREPPRTLRLHCNLRSRKRMCKIVTSHPALCWHLAAQLV